MRVGSAPNSACTKYSYDSGWQTLGGEWTARETLSELPYKQESIANVLVCSTIMHVHLGMHDLSNSVHKAHDTLLQDLGQVCEVADVTEAKYSHLHQTPRRDLDIPTLL